MTRSRTFHLIAWSACFWIYSANAKAQADFSSPVIDRAAVLEPAVEERIAARLRSHYEAGHAQIAVVVLRSTGGVPIEEYALSTAERWKLGREGKDDGVLFVLAIDDRAMRIEVGYGLEATLTDHVADRILDNITSSLREGQYQRAVLEVVNALVAKTGGAALDPLVLSYDETVAEAFNPHRPPPPSRSSDGEHVDGSGDPSFGAVLFYVIVGALGLVAMFVGLLVRGDDRGGDGYRSSGHYSHARYRSSSSTSSRSWSRSSGGSSSRSYSGGGGSFGGGGASRRW